MFYLLLHEWLKLNGPLPRTLRPVRVLVESGDKPAHADAMLRLSFVDSPPPTDPTPIQPTETETVEEVSTNPQVAALQAIFPDFDPIILCAEPSPSPRSPRS